MDESRNLGSMKYTIPKEQIPEFLAELRRIQTDMIEELVRRKERAGFPEAKEVLDRIAKM